MNEYAKMLEEVEAELSGPRKRGTSKHRSAAVLATDWEWVDDYYYKTNTKKLKIWHEALKLFKKSIGEE